ncbi:hypothetical protein MUK42_01701 [Musa troglodytarum]|uniref:Uncharacterized protein n=1 Tax=Musa troglodytarum TaxID=320322 RepID=A0A9E7HNT3_9LILI|nr:hypothetical protein MUK42_01701 [Musa troglodytarum]URE36844.1 hypothetical protein MUK42_01701 [Musa troglodytarum]
MKRMRSWHHQVVALMTIIVIPCPAQVQLESEEKWKVLLTYGNTPATRFHLVATLLGSKSVAIGGESNAGLLDDILVTDNDLIL